MYSKVININSDIKSAEIYMVYPNPFGSKLQARIESAKAEQAMVRIINSNGSIVKAQTISLQAGATDVSINDISSLVPGAYYFELITSTNTSRMKIIKK